MKSRRTALEKEEGRLAVRRQELQQQVGARCVSPASSLCLFGHLCAALGAWHGLPCCPWRNPASLPALGQFASQAADVQERRAELEQLEQRLQQREEVGFC